MSSLIIILIIIVIILLHNHEKNTFNFATVFTNEVNPSRFEHLCYYCHKSSLNYKQTITNLLSNVLWQEEERDVAPWSERSLMVQWIVGSILHGVDPLSYFSFQPVLHDWCNKGRGMCYPVCGMVHIKEPLLLVGKSSPCDGRGFTFSISEWSLTICLMPYNRK